MIVTPHLTTFIGREHELAEIAALLADPACRLLTLVGPGGIGKTRLSLEATRTMDFPNGVHFVPLQPVSDAALLPIAIANAIGIQFFGTDEPRVQLLNYLQNRQILLILDNFEHLLDGVDFVVEMLNARGVKVLVTSRTALNIQAEWRYAVGGLSVPESKPLAQGERGWGEGFEDSDAVRLFSERARRLRHDFDPADHRDDLIRICQLTEGMPLALELAAGWLKALSCAEIANEMQRGLDFLAADVRDVPERHRSMAAAFAQSWNLLTDDEQKIFRRMSVFRGGFTREAAEKVTGATLQILASLVDKSLLRVSATGRYDVHELMRQYSEAMLDTLPVEHQKAHDLHCAYYSNFMDQQWENLQGRYQKVAMQAIQIEIDNVETAWHWAVEQIKGQEIEKLLESLRFFYDARLWFDRAERVLKAAIDAFYPTKAECGLLYSKLLVRYGAFCFSLRRQDVGLALVGEALTILRCLDAHRETAFALQTLAQLHDLDEAATQRYKESLAIYREIGDHQGAANILLRLSVQAYFAHKYAESAQFSRESLAFYREIGNPGGIAECLALLGWCAYGREVYREAKQFHHDNLAFAVESQNDWHIMKAPIGLGLAQWALGERSEALQLLQNGLMQTLKAGPETVPAIPYVLIDLWSLFEKERAVELLSLGLRPAEWILPPPTQKRAEQALEKLKAEMSPDIFQAAFERGKNFDLRATIEWLVSYLSTAQNNPQTIRSTLDPLTERELEVLRLVAAGLSNAQIARRLVVVIGTAKAHIHNIYTKLGVESRTQAIVRAKELHLI